MRIINWDVRLPASGGEAAEEDVENLRDLSYAGQADDAPIDVDAAKRLAMCWERAMAVSKNIVGSARIKISKYFVCEISRSLLQREEERSFSKRSEPRSSEEPARPARSLFVRLSGSRFEDLPAGSAAGSPGSKARPSRRPNSSINPSREFDEMASGDENVNVVGGQAAIHSESRDEEMAKARKASRRASDLSLVSQTLAISNFPPEVQAIMTEAFDEDGNGHIASAELVESAKLTIATR
ncbi:hypothetical protein THAOC_30093, partial [Thalassiosira oceanica]